MKDSYFITIKQDFKSFILSVPGRIIEENRLEGCWRQVSFAELTNPLIVQLPQWVLPNGMTKSVEVFLNLIMLNDLYQEGEPQTSINSWKIGRFQSVNQTKPRILAVKVGTKSTDNIHHYMGRFCFNVLPFATSSDSKKCQKNVSQILWELAGVECNIDNVPGPWKRPNEQDERLEAASG